MSSKLFINCILLFFFLQCSQSVKFTVVNKCDGPIWPGIYGVPLVENGGFKLEKDQSRVITVPDGWKAARIWARTWCDNNLNCGTGFCGVSFFKN